VKIKFVVVLILLLLLTVPVYAEESPIDVSSAETELPADAVEITGKLVTDGNYDLDGAVGRLMRKAKQETIERMKSEAKDMLRLVAIAVVCSVAESLCPDGRTAEIISLCACAAAAAAVTGPIDSLAGRMDAALRTLSDYGRAVLPAVYTATAVSGAVVSAGARYAAVVLCLNILMDVLIRFAIPMIYAFLAICLSKSVFPNPVLNTAASTVKWCTTTGLTVVTLGISTYITLTGALTSGADAVAVKGGRMIISSALPVVGGIMSDASAVVLASASVIKNAAGVFALIGISAVCLAPFVAIGVKMLLFRLCAAVASAIEGKRLSQLLSDLSAALGMMLGVLGSVTIMLFISFMAAIKTVSP